MEFSAAVAQLTEAWPGLQAVYLFGSVASGEDNAASDLDLAVLAPTKMDPTERWKLQERIAAKVGQSVDLVDLRAASTVMRMEVVKNGRVIADLSSNARHEFEAIALGAYARLNERRRGILDDVKTRGTVHG